MSATVLGIAFAVSVVVGVVLLTVRELVREFGTKSSSDMPIEQAWRINEIYTATREKMIRESGWYQPDENR